MKKGDSITMTRAEQRWLMILNQVAAGALVNAEGASLLGLSVRQLQRVRAAYRQTGAAALTHGNRGRRPSNALEAGVVDRVLELATTKYLGFNQHHLTEMLTEHEGLTLSRPSVHRILKAAGVAAPRKRRPPRHRRRFARSGGQARRLSQTVEGGAFRWHQWVLSHGHAHPSR